MMQRFIGYKVVNAAVMTRGQYNALRGWEVPADEDPEDQGFLVEYLDGGRSNHPDYKGYISWSPRDVFERAYRPSGTLPFGLALEALKAGHVVTRAGWNGKGMWLSMSGDTPHARYVEQDKFWSKNNSDFALRQGGAARVLPCITMKTADDAILMGWLASQSDMLAEDWMILR